MSYWETPQDIPASWTRAKGTLETFTKEYHGLCVTVTAVTENGTLLAIGVGNPVKVEPDVGDRGRGWWLFIRRLISVASLEKARMGSITSQVFINSYGHPTKWTHPQMTRLEPKK